MNLRTGSMFALLLFACAPAGAQTCAFSAMQTRFENLLQAQGLPGGAIQIGDRQGVLYERFFGSYTGNTVVPIASASKLLSGVRILQLIDQGALDPAAPVSFYLPQFTGEKGTMNVLQMFSHSAGYGDDSGDPLVFDNTLTLPEAVDQIACCRPLNTGYTVGGQFSYGGVSMHVGGRVAEVVSGEDWQAGWIARIGVPLGVSSIDWQGLGPTANYGIAGSARSSLRDYGRVLQMLGNRGRGNNRQVLSPAAVARLQVNAAAGLPVAYAPPNVTPPVRYGVGAWIDGVGGPDRPGFLHSLGAFGFMPWVDFDRELYGVFMIRGGAFINSFAIPAYREMLAAIETEIDGGNCDWVQRFDEVFVDGVEPD
jgi:CubicO group peptidase (beta-lactamase class C family)